MADKEGKNAFHHLLEQRRPFHKFLQLAIELLQSYRVDINAIDHRGYTPLATYMTGPRPVSRFDSRKVDLLVPHGARTELKLADGSGMNLLHLAAAHHRCIYMGMVLALERAELDVRSLDGKGRSCLHLMAKEGYMRRDVLEYIESLLRLIERV